MSGLVPLRSNVFARSVFTSIGEFKLFVPDSLRIMIVSDLSNLVFISSRFIVANRETTDSIGVLIREPPSFEVFTGLYLDTEFMIRSSLKFFTMSS